jgi:hypothetical protein
MAKKKGIPNVIDQLQDAIRNSGQGTVNWTPPTTGIYQGISIFQDRTSTVPVSLAGNGNMYVTGTFYAAKAVLNIQGASGSNTIGSQYVSYDLSLGGNGGITIDYTAAPHPQTRRLGLVE